MDPSCDYAEFCCKDHLPKPDSKKKGQLYTGVQLEQLLDVKENEYAKKYSIVCSPPEQSELSSKSSTSLGTKHRPHSLKTKLRAKVLAHRNPHEAEVSGSPQRPLLVKRPPVVDSPTTNKQKKVCRKSVEKSTPKIKSPSCKPLLLVTKTSHDKTKSRKLKGHSRKIKPLEPKGTLTNQQKLQNLTSEVKRSIIYSLLKKEDGKCTPYVDWKIVEKKYFSSLDRTSYTELLSCLEEPSQYSHSKIDQGLASNEILKDVLQLKHKTLIKVLLNTCKLTSEEAQAVSCMGYFRMRQPKASKRSNSKSSQNRLVLDNCAIKSNLDLLEEALIPEKLSADDGSLKSRPSYDVRQLPTLEMIKMVPLHKTTTKEVVERQQYFANNFLSLAQKDKSEVDNTKNEDLVSPSYSIPAELYYLKYARQSNIDTILNCVQEKTFDKEPSYNSDSSKFICDEKSSDLEVIHRCATRKLLFTRCLKNLSKGLQDKKLSFEEILGFKKDLCLKLGSKRTKSLTAEELSQEIKERRNLEVYCSVCFLPGTVDEYKDSRDAPAASMIYCSGRCRASFHKDCNQCIRSKKIIESNSGYKCDCCKVSSKSTDGRGSVLTQWPSASSVAEKKNSF